MLEAVNCKNCGASKFIREDGGLVCSYCFTRYQEVAKKSRSRKNIWLTIGALTVTTFLIIWFLITNTLNIHERKSATPQVSATLQKAPSNRNSTQYAREHISKIKGWTLAKYSNIKLAEQIVTEESAYPHYQNGMLFSSLEQSIGSPPDSLKESRTQGNKIEATATWTTDASLEDGEVTVSISYDKTTGQILRKNLFGQLYEKE